jgi:hypothetical protein
MVSSGLPFCFSHAINIGSCLASRICKRCQRDSTAEMLLFLSTSPGLTDLGSIRHCSRRLVPQPDLGHNEEVGTSRLFASNLSLPHWCRHATASLPAFTAFVMNQHLLFPLLYLYLS